MKRPFVLFVALACWCMAFLSVLGDFTPYVGVPDGDVLVEGPDLGPRLAQAAVVALAFSAACTVLFVLIGRLLPGYRVLRLGAVAALGFTPLVYVYGDFKTVFGGGPPYWVQFELPWGAARLGCSAVGGLLLGGLTAVAAACAVQASRAHTSAGDYAESIF